MRAHGGGAVRERRNEAQSPYAQLRLPRSSLPRDPFRRWRVHLATCRLYSVRGTRSVPCRDACADRHRPARSSRRQGQSPAGCHRRSRWPAGRPLFVEFCRQKLLAPSLQARLMRCRRHLCCQEDKAEGLHPRCDNRASKKGRHWEKVRTPTSPACLSEADAQPRCVLAAVRRA